MSTFLTILLVAAMIAVVVVLVRGLVVFLLGASQDLRDGTSSDRVSASSIQSNKMMQYRVMFQAIAIFLVVLLMWLAGKS
ncbi:twin transmembrane helix small protein [Sphingomonas glacialis]|uniref:Twin transmembrane helix small protein n=1 Tax=Sphingomonas glacialis TaxID=658225 RepID=A0A502FFM6_9SPHN|nr:twin transmembrane helix small protein [Sphingomonas glacialis]TPG48240.1 twin transmembrane helix small protein [Sphingomonas glacialis]